MRWPIGEVVAGLATESPDALVVAALGTWLDALATWNAKMDLTAAKEPRAIAWLMLADAMMLARVVPRGASVVDVGTGAGAPGFALAILRPDLRVTLCEPLGKRAAFLRTSIGLLSRTDVALDPRAADKLDPGKWDVAVSRATFPPSEWLAIGSTLARAGGSVWLTLAQEEPPAPERAVETLAYDDASTGAKKKLVRYSVGP